MWALVSANAAAQRGPANDGFQRRGGIMYLIRNGEKRLMTHDVHLPNGRTITKDGFVVAPDGHRSELGEGEGCSLTGAVVAVAATSSGRLSLGGTPVSRSEEAPVAVGMEEFFSLPGKHLGWGKNKKHGKHKRKKDDKGDN